MTATVPTAPRTVPAAAPRTGLTVLRLHRGALIVWTLLVLAAALGFLWAYGPGADSALAAWHKACPAADDSCHWDTTLNDYYRTVSLAEWTIFWAPQLVSVWAGAALIARELENGTARLAWTQGVTPARWLAAKLAVPAALITAGTTVLVLLHRMVFEANEFPFGWEWYQDTIFSTNGPVGIAQPLLALTVGALAGLVLRRTLPALAVSFLVTGLVQYVTGEVTPQLWPWKTFTAAMDSARTVPDHVMWGEQGSLTATGARVPTPDCADSMKCLADHGVTGYYTDYHPASHFWPLQLIETGLTLAVAAAAVGAAFWLLRRRTRAL
ncbi:hypothetical protein [Streptomyces sp. NPDC046909]|uniref:hypothetical protein n=1 Tax=Streptomyces sp. NPDC046909 TaxID=3155617 RepID=UPI0033C95F60